VKAAAASRRYAAALVVARTALEHHLLDRLLFLGNRWVVSYGVKTTQVAAEEKRLAGLKAGSRPDIARWRHDPRTGLMKVVIRGLFREGSLGRGTTLSPYYFRVDRYDPFTGGKRLAGRLARGFKDRSTNLRRAEESAREWHEAFAFDRLRASLDANRLLVPRLGVQVEVHHAFLSAYVHGTQAADDLVYGGNTPRPLGAFDHYADELCLLYVLVLAAAELEVFGRMARRRPRLKLADWPTVERDVADARLASEYFWFLSGGPHVYDRIEELHTRMERRKRPWTLPRVNPVSLPAERVRFYSNPLRRLVALHRSSQEFISGQVFPSPFERADARFRR
jgi:hypothetical protein